MLSPRETRTAGDLTVQYWMEFQQELDTNKEAYWKDG